MTNAVATKNTNLATMPIEQALEMYAPNFAAVLPPNISVDHFKRMVVTALNINPALANADRRTLFNSCVKCASDGLLPDGREAALVVYKTKVKDAQGRERWIEAVQFMPMVAGIRKRLRNSGEVDSATAEVVYRRDRFKYALGDQAFIEHEPPSLDEDRGDPVGAYAIIKLTSGETIREVMGIKEIERARSVSRAKDKSPWVEWWGEMARKTVLRRAAKAAPQASVLEKLLMRDDEIDEPQAGDLSAIPPRPTREQFALPPQEYVDPGPEPAPTYAVVDLDGVETEYDAPKTAGLALIDVLHDAAKQGLTRLVGAWESNLLREAMPEDVEHRLLAAYRNLHAELTRKAASPPPTPAAERPEPVETGLLTPAPARGDDITETAADAGGSSAAQAGGGSGVSPPAAPYSPAGTDQPIAQSGDDQKGQSTSVDPGYANTPPAGRGNAATPTSKGVMPHSGLELAPEQNKTVPPSLAAGATDLLGDPPAENLWAPLPTEGVRIRDWAYYGRQVLAIIAEDPKNGARAAQISRTNEGGLHELKAHDEPLYQEVQRALVNARRA